MDIRLSLRSFWCPVLELTAHTWPSNTGNVASLKCAVEVNYALDSRDLEFKKKKKKGKLSQFLY